MQSFFFTFPHWPSLLPVRRHGICQIFYKFPFFQFYPWKTRKSLYSRHKIENVRCFTHLFRTNCQFCAISTHLQNRSSYFMKTQALKMANFADRVICFINSLQFYPSPKIFYTSATCATCDKFQVCSFIFVTFNQIVIHKSC